MFVGGGVEPIEQLVLGEDINQQKADEGERGEGHGAQLCESVIGSRPLPAREAGNGRKHDTGLGHTHEKQERDDEHGKFRSCSGLFTCRVGWNRGSQRHSNSQQPTRSTESSSWRCGLGLGTCWFSIHQGPNSVLT